MPSTVTTWSERSHQLQKNASDPSQRTTSAANVRFCPPFMTGTRKGFDVLRATTERGSSAGRGLLPPERRAEVRRAEVRRLAARVTAADRQLGGGRRLALAQQARGEPAQVGAAVQVVGRGAAQEIGDEGHAGAHGGEQLAARQAEAEEQQATAVARGRRRRLDHGHPGRQRMQPQPPARDVVGGRDDRDALQLVRGVVDALERQVQARQRPGALARQRDEDRVGREVAVGLLARGHRVAAGTQSRGDRRGAADRGHEGEPEGPGRPGQEPHDDQADGGRGERPQQQRLGRGGERSRGSSARLPWPSWA